VDTSSGSSARTEEREGVTAVPEVEAGNGHSVRVREAKGSWSVAIVDPQGREVSVRACRDETEARTFASTVRQHIAWLSEPRFREIYRLAEGG
jgi:hypothetical protein